MENNEDEPDDVKKATPVESAILEGNKDEKNEIKGKKPKSAPANLTNREKPTDRRCKLYRSKYPPPVIKTKKSCHPKVEIICRDNLSKHEYIDILATPKKNRENECKQTFAVSPSRREKSTPRPISDRLEELAKPKPSHVIDLLQTWGDRLRPEVIDAVQKSLEESCAMSPEQMEAYYNEKDREECSRTRRVRKKKCPDKTKKKPTTCDDHMDKQAVCEEYEMAQRFMRHVIFHLKNCPFAPEDHYDLTEVILYQLGGVLDYRPSGDGDRKFQMMLMLANGIACWVHGLNVAVAEKLAKEQTAEAKEAAENAETEEEDDEEGKQGEAMAEATEEEEEEEEEEAGKKGADEESGGEVGEEKDIKDAPIDVEVATENEEVVNVGVVTENEELIDVGVGDTEVGQKVKEEEEEEEEGEAGEEKTEDTEGDTTDETKVKTEAEEIAQEETEGEEESVSPGGQETAEKDDELKTEGEEEVRQEETEDEGEPEAVEETAKDNESIKLTEEPGLAIKGLGEGDLFGSEIPFVTFGKIMEIALKFLEKYAEAETTEVRRRLQNAVLAKLTNLVLAEAPDALDNNMKAVLEVLAENIAVFMEETLSESKVNLVGAMAPEVESTEVRDWGHWLETVMDNATNWGKWIHAKVGEAEEKARAKVTRGEWQNWTSTVDSEALRWRMFNLDTKHRMHHADLNLTHKKVVHRGDPRIGNRRTSAVPAPHMEPDETEINAHDLSDGEHRISPDHSREVTQNEEAND